jgi:two-component system sensor histidine kinase KdpD
MERLIANLLDTARLESGMMQLKTDWCDIEDIIGAALRRLGELLKNDQVKVKLAADLPLLRADCVLIEQVLVNLIDNAVKHSSGKGNILIEVEHVKGGVMVSVSNQGSEIPATELTRIFDKFYRIKQTRQVSGTGLGLSICKGIIEAHKGRIWAENVQNGVAIRFELPAHGEAT